MNTDEMISELDRNHFKMLRENVRNLIKSAAEHHDKNNLLVLDIAPQDHAGVREFFQKAQVKTFDINPMSNADIIGDICKLNVQIADSTFDFIVCTEVLEHTLDPFSAINELYRILKPGGILLASTPLNFRIHGPLPDCWRFTIHGLKHMLRNFSSVEITEYQSFDNRFLMPLQYGIHAVK
ncbi:MAG: class I SAM-dependent methyltransferase [Bdellovibrionaceae bacterium]|nr:class I SAM-dependent methyltransferase [Pseudobdellovibrionaceae bacterium]